MASARSRLVLAGVLVQLLVACGGDDPKAVDYSKVKLFVNELQPSNQITVYDELNEADDWFELYNAGEEDLDLTGFYVSDDRAALKKHQLAAGVTVDAGGVVIIWADGDPEQGANHLPYKLSAAGESVVISDPNGEELDAADYVVGPSGNSFARFPDGTGEFAWCAAPTPKVLNGDACQATTL